MFDQLISLKKPLNKFGIIESVRGDHYLARQVDTTGKVVKRASQTFRCFDQAKRWLRKQGVNTISLRQTHAYYEMIGLDG